MNYTLHQLQIFLKITQTQSITKAAEDLHLTQPAVSIQLKNFQDQFEIPLINIIGRRIFITDFGREIAVAAENILNEVYAINYKTMAHKGQLTGRLKISIVSTGQYIMPYFLSDFLQQHTGIELMLDVTNKAKVLESLKNNEVDFSLVSVLPEQLPIDKITLMDNKLFLVNNKNTSFNTKAYDKNFLETLPLIYREPGSGTRYVMEQFIEQNNLSVRKKMELTSNEAVKQAVIAGLGCSIMPLIGIKNEITNGDLQIIPVKGLPIISKWNIIWMKSKNFSPVSTSFLKYLEEEKDRIMLEKFDWIK
ncbi:LysR family transcriptional regulator [Limnovirga soli]|uniref:LysR family transcriptional regulator n=1 Tax=Limnovirga soli TaxID=2656915 RepID=A0A8J8JVF4_9BACT|nr:LysR family transcriptional regulator [Limnovirga soli]NNV57335.1 LysR family transcriptional regulator [Limnovirga soli]